MPCARVVGGAVPAADRGRARRLAARPRAALRRAAPQRDPSHRRRRSCACGRAGAERLGPLRVDGNERGDLLLVRLRPSRERARPPRRAARPLGAARGRRLVRARDAVSRGLRTSPLRRVALLRRLARRGRRGETRARRGAGGWPLLRRAERAGCAARADPDRPSAPSRLEDGRSAEQAGRRADPRRPAAARRRHVRAVRRPRRPGHLAALAAGQDDPPVGKRYERPRAPVRNPFRGSLGPEQIATLQPVPETILVVDDQDVVRDVIKLTLESAGYTVLEAATPKIAIELARSAAAIDLLVTDIVMPEMDAFELAERINTEIPGVRILYTSGYTDAAAEGPFIQKPFTPQQLVEKVSAVLAT